eukprot:2461072-Rhodomonas_salina.1
MKIPDTKANYFPPRPNPPAPKISPQPSSGCSVGGHACWGPVSVVWTYSQSWCWSRREGCLSREAFLPA